MHFSTIIVAALSAAALGQATASTEQHPYVGAYVTKVPSMTNDARPTPAPVVPGPPLKASSAYASYISAKMSVSTMSAAAAKESSSLKHDKHQAEHDLKKECHGDKTCEKKVHKAFKGKQSSGADNLQLQLTAVMVGFAALGGAFMLI